MKRLKAARRLKHSRALHCKYAVVDAKLGKRKVRLFLCKRTKAEKWRLLVTTDPRLDFMGAYRIYAMRWGVEVFYGDTKRYLGIGDCSCRNFTSQVGPCYSGHHTIQLNGLYQALPQLRDYRRTVPRHVSRCKGDNGD